MMIIKKISLLFQAYHEAPSLEGGACSLVATDKYF